MLPELLLAPEALPLRKVMADELVEPADWSAVASKVDSSRVAITLPPMFRSPLWATLAPLDWTRAMVPERSGRVSVRAAVAVPVNWMLLALPLAPINSDW